MFTFLSTSAWIYLSLLALLLFFRLVFQDRWWWLGLLNGLTFYWFAPLLIVIPLAITGRQPILLLAALLAGAIFVTLFGQLYLPKPRPALLSGKSLTAMTYNLLNINENIPGILGVIQESGADVIAFQELNAETAAAIQKDLAQTYPYQILGQQAGQISVPFNSVISRYPLRLVQNTFPGYWKTDPQVYELDFDGARLWVVAVHAQPIFLASLNVASITKAFRLREEQARALAAFAARVEYPLIVLTDFNATDQNRSYRLITKQLIDSWRETGWGPGLTFGIRRNTFGAIKPLGFPILLPRWLLRIDHVFHTQDLKAVRIRLGQWDGVSDHRPVIATLKRVVA